MKTIKKNKATKKCPATKVPAEDKFEKMIKEIQVQPSKGNDPDFMHNDQSTWIVSDNNSTFKSFINYG